MASFMMVSGFSMPSFYRKMLRKILEEASHHDLDP
jgi:hypothetical protein